MTEQPPPLTTPRLVLRGLRLLDAERVATLATAAVLRQLTWFRPAPAAPWIRAAHDAWTAGTGVTFAIVARGTLVGAIGLAITRPHDHAELGCWLGPTYWGRGLAAEAGRAVVAWAIPRFKLRRVFGQYLGDNHAAGRVLEKIGLIREGVRRGHIKQGARWYDAHQFGMLRDELSP